MKNILIPTNFNTEALACIPALAQQAKDTEINFIFVHLLKCSDSISELLMMSRRNREYEFISDAFYQKCEEIKSSYPQVKAIKLDFFYGSTLSMFRNYLEANSINAVLDLKHCSTGPLNKFSVDPANLIAKCGLETIKIQAAAMESRESHVLNPAYNNLLTEAV
jgi:hypothetical protein